MMYSSCQTTTKKMGPINHGWFWRDPGRHTNHPRQCGASHDPAQISQCDHGDPRRPRHRLGRLCRVCRPNNMHPTNAQRDVSLYKWELSKSAIIVYLWYSLDTPTDGYMHFSRWLNSKFSKYAFGIGINHFHLYLSVLLCNLFESLVHMLFSATLGTIHILKARSLPLKEGGVRS